MTVIRVRYLQPFLRHFSMNSTGIAQELTLILLHKDWSSDNLCHLFETWAVLPKLTKCNSDSKSHRLWCNCEKIFKRISSGKASICAPRRMSLEALRISLEVVLLVCIWCRRLLGGSKAILSLSNIYRLFRFFLIWCYKGIQLSKYIPWICLNLVSWLLVLQIPI